MPRLFVAVDLPETTRKILTGMCFGIPGARWVPEDQIHLTLRFIGEVDGGLSLDISEALDTVRFPSFAIRLQGVGHFPPRKNPRVLWVGIEQNQDLFLLRQKIDAALAKTGLAAEGRKYSPHITLARLNNAPVSRIGNFLAGNGLFETGPFEIRQFYLYSSILTPKGAIHRQEASYLLRT